MVNKNFKSVLFGWELHKYTKRHNIPTRKLAEICEVNYKTALKWVNGESMPNDYSLQVIDYKTGIDAMKYQDEEWLESMAKLYEEGMQIHEMF